MSANHERRSRLMGLTLRRHAWEMEELKEGNRKAQEDLSTKEEALQQSHSDICQAEDGMRKALEGGVSLDPASLIGAQAFLEELQSSHRENKQQHRRAEQRAQQAEDQLSQGVLFEKAVEQIKETSDRYVVREREKKIQDYLSDLWVQRFGRDGWETKR